MPYYVNIAKSAKKLQQYLKLFYDYNESQDVKQLKCLTTNTI